MTQEPNIFPYIARLLQGAEVVWKPLGEVLLSVRTGLNPRQFFTLNTENAKNYYITIRELRGGKIIPSDKTDKMNDEALKLCQKRSNLEVGDILFSGTGTIGEMAIIKEDPTNWNIKEGVYSLKPNLSIVTSGYICHILNSQEIRNKILNKSVGGTVKSIPMKELQQIEIPLPPLSVQQEIVRILDKFTQLEAELEAELDCRKRQYEYYRNKLLTFNEIGGTEIVWKTLGEVFTLRNGYTPSKSNNDFWENGTIPWFRMEDIRANGRVLNDAIQKVSRSAVKGGKLFPANSIMLSTTATIGEHALIQVDYLSNQQLTNFSLTEDFSHQVDIKYVFHYFFLINEELKRIGSDATLQIIGIKKLEKIKIPLPPLEEQQRIASILDKFDTLVNSISEGLPKEIALRRKQYEYYRERLLSF